MCAQPVRQAPNSGAQLGLRLRLTGQRAVTRFFALIGDPFARLLCSPWRDDPYAHYAVLRAEGPVVRTRFGVHAVTTHALCEEVLRDRRFGVRDSRGDYADPTAAAVDLQLSLLEQDPPDHTRLRKLAAPAFRPRRMAQFRSRITEVADELLAETAGRREFDVVRDFATPLPVRVICELMGLPPLDAQRLAHHGRILSGALDGVQSGRQLRRMRESYAAMDALFEELVAQRRSSPGDDVVSDLVAAVDEDELTGRELVQLCTLLLVAGFETTVNLIANGTRALLDHPAQWEQLKADPSLAPAVVEETLRWDPPVQMTVRVAHEPVTLDGHRLPTDTPVILLLASAGRDPQAHRAPNTFDITRPETSDHLAFSSGIHYCLGAPLARIEGEIAFRSLATHLPDLNPHPARSPTPRPTTVIHGPKTLPTTT
ncbi:cytochrome P450 [Saccharopolyspora griseoalba]|uniref:Cytochrome P450 n=1 Tax=Saccharopolyspora griseoalba TaxID=1431848 RepID=A0ABW2LE00_9PSEU